jgi:hypothetical protein
LALKQSFGGTMGYKNDIFNHVVKMVEDKASHIESIAQGEKAHALSQDGAMKSRYDTMRTEGSWLADGLGTRTAELYQDVRRAQQFQLPEGMTKVGLGSLLRVVAGREIAHYFVLPFGGGESIEYNGTQITIISPVSPLGKELIGQPPGSSFSVKNTNYTILNLE